MKLSEHLPERPLRAEDVESLAAMDGVEAVEPLAYAGVVGGVSMFRVRTSKRTVSYTFDLEEEAWSYDEGA